MKAGIAALVVAAEHAARIGTHGDIVLALVADEEHGSLGTTAVIGDLARTAGCRTRASSPSPRGWSSRARIAGSP